MTDDFYVYILKGPKNRYIGSTSNVQKRLDEHNNGMTWYTRTRGPWLLEWTSIPLSHAEAVKLERLLKKQKGGVGCITLMKKYQNNSKIS